MNRTRRGSALLEFAIAFAILVPVTVGAVQFIFAYLEVNQLQLVVQRAAREASGWSWEAGMTEPSPSFRRRVENMVLYGTQEEGPTVLIPNLTRDQVGVEVSSLGGLPRSVRVSISGYPLALPGGSRLLNGEPSFAYPFHGRLSAE